MMRFGAKGAKKNIKLDREKNKLSVNEKRGLLLANVNYKTK